MRGLVGLLAWAAGCTTDPELVIDVRTDLVPGVEFSVVRVEVASAPIGAAVAERHDERAIRPDDDFIRGVRIAELTGLTEGTVHARVSLLAPDGSVALARPILVDLRGRQLVTVVFTR